MKRVLAISFVFVLVFGLVSAASAQDTGAEETTLNTVPPWVLDTAQHAGDHYFGSVTLETVQFDPEGVPAYEFSGTAEGVEGFEIDVEPDGRLQEIEETIADADIPAEIMTIVTTYAANMEISQYERSTRPGYNGVMEVWYEFTGTLNGTEVDVEVKEDGSMLVIELPSMMDSSM